jgi:hypothetical protein
MDPDEEYDRFMGGVSPTSANGALQTSPGRWLGGDNAWTLALVNVALNKLNATFAKYPNIPIIPGGATIGADVPSFVPTKLFEGKLPGAENAHPAAKEIPIEKYK